MVESVRINYFALELDILELGSGQKRKMVAGRDFHHHVLVWDYGSDL